MRNLALPLLLLFCVPAISQDHFSGINTSQRTGILNGQMNPAEFVDISPKYMIQVFALSGNIANNKIGFNDLLNESDFENIIFQGNDAINLRFDAEISGPGFAYQMDKWAFALTSKAYSQTVLVDVDPNIGDAISNGENNSIFSNTLINNRFNQRINGTTWGEIGLSAARNVFQSGRHSVNAGLTLKLLFPGSYVNFGADKFTGNINTTAGVTSLTNANASVNIAYSGDLGEDFTDFTDYSKSLFGGLRGVAFDLGASYKYMDSSNEHYIVKAGIAFRNMGSMTFKDNNNSSTNYALSIQGAESLNLDQFQDVKSIEAAENILLNSGYLDKNVNRATDFKVKLPSVFSVYADVKVVPSFYVTLYSKQKFNDDSGNTQISTQNIISLTPRYTIKNFEVWSTWADNEISGISGGLGLRAYGFFIGSGSAITVLLSDNAKQGDFYIGYSFGLK